MTNMPLEGARWSLGFSKHNNLQLEICCKIMRVLPLIITHEFHGHVQEDHSAVVVVKRIESLNQNVNVQVVCMYNFKSGQCRPFTNYIRTILQFFDQLTHLVMLGFQRFPANPSLTDHTVFGTLE